MSLLILVLSAVLLFIVVALVVLVCLAVYIIRVDKKQTQHSILRNFPLVGRIRYIIEHVSPELRQYLFEDDDAKPFSRHDFRYIVKAGKYLSSIIAFGSKRDFDAEGYYLRNAFFPKQMTEMKVDNDKQQKTQVYKVDEETLISRKEHAFATTTKLWELSNEDAVIIGEKTCKYPFKTKSIVGMSAMSYGAIGENAVQALSIGLGMANSWMNTGEGGISEHHLIGKADIIAQIGPGLFGYRDTAGNFNWDELKKKAQIEQVKAFEIKLGQGAKIRGGHVEAQKVTPEIAKIRGVEPYKTIDSPNRFNQFSNSEELLAFIDEIRKVAEKPVGIKIVVGDNDSLEEFAETMKRMNLYPDFITVDGGEGGTGATYQSMADSVGLPLRSALVIANEALTKYGLRDDIKIIASGKLFSPDRIAIALGMGADLINIARGFMISVGCIGAQRCHSNDCPVGVATTDPNLQKALVIDEKKYRVLNYVVSMRQDLFALAAACGIESPSKFESKHIIYKEANGAVHNLKDLVNKSK